jgi:hypothetical protein
MLCPTGTGLTPHHCGARPPLAASRLFSPARGEIGKPPFADNFLHFCNSNRLEIGSKINAIDLPTCGGPKAGETRGSPWSVRQDRGGRLALRVRESHPLHLAPACRKSGRPRGRTLQLTDAQSGRRRHFAGHRRAMTRLSEATFNIAACGPPHAATARRAQTLSSGQQSA